MGWWRGMDFEVEQLRKEVEKLRDEVEDLQRATKMMPSNGNSFDQVPLKRVVQMVLNYLDVELQEKPATSARFELKNKEQKVACKKKSG